MQNKEISEENVNEENISEDIKPEENSNDSNTDDISLMAASGTYYADYHIWYDQTSHSITGADNVANITIPSYVDGYIVTSIANNAFLNCTNLQSISIPDTVTSIGYRAFQGCTSLSNIVIPASVESGSNWFEGCANLKEVTFASGTRTIPDYALQNTPALEKINMSTGVVTIGSYAFADCPMIEDIAIPTTVTNLGYRTFQNDIGLGNITIPKNVEKGNNWFEGCANLKEVTFASGTRTIPDYALQNTPALETINMESGITTIGNYAFADCPLVEKITLPSTITALGYRVFQNDCSLKDIVIPAGVVNGSNLFDNCVSLKKITFADGTTSIPNNICANTPTVEEIVLPNGVTKIGSNSFEGCYALKNITLPSTLNEIGYRVFYNCYYIVLECNNEQSANYAEENNISYKWDGNFIDKGLNIVVNNSQTTPQGTYYEQYDVYFDAATNTITGCGNKLENINIPNYIEGEAVEKIDASAFKNCTVVKSIIIPDSVTKIESTTFENCILLDNIQLPQSLYYIGYRAFANCLSLTEITIPENVSDAGSGSYTGNWFYGCYKLKKITFANGINKIPAHACENTPMLETIILSDTLNSIGSYAFQNCPNLNGISLPNSLTSIYYRAFANCLSLTEITIPQNVSNAGSGSYTGNWFCSCYKLKKITFADGIKEIPAHACENTPMLETIILSDTLNSIGSYAFQNCPNLNGISLPNALVNINYRAFANCLSLTEITIPQNVSNAGSGSYTGNWFCGCYKLKKITFANGINEIPAHACENTPMLETIVLSNTLKSIGSYAFQSCLNLNGISLPDSLTSIYYRAFANCLSLTEITIPQSVSNAGSGSYTGNWFYGCYKLADIELESGATVIPNSAFANCICLNKITIPSSVREIQSNAFDNSNKVVIYCYPNSYALSYAKTNGIPYVLLAYSNEINDNSGWSHNSNTEDNTYTDPSVSNNSLGVNQNSFKSITSNKDKLRGPKITILGKSFYLFELPIDMSIKTPLAKVKYNSDNEKFEITLGKLDKSALAGLDGDRKTYNEIKEFVQTVSRGNYTTSWNGYQHLKSVLKSENMSFGFSFNATPAGYMEFDKNGKLLEGSIVYLLNMDYNTKSPIPAAPIFYIKVGLGVDATGKFGIKSVETNAYAVFGSLGLDVSPYVGVGFGSSKIANVEGGAKLKLSTTLEVATNKQLKDAFTATMTGSLYLKLKALAFINFDKKWDIAKTSIYPDFGIDLMSIEDYDTDMVVMPYEYSDEPSDFVANSSDNIQLTAIDNVDTSTFKTNIYPNAEPQLVKLNDGRELLLWIDNDGSRSDINRSVLKYSINNNGTWSNPADIFNNGTADFTPKVAVTQNGAAVVWQKANKTLSENASLSEMAQTMDLYYSELNGSNWSSAIKLTDNNTVYEFGADIASNGTEITVTWAENSENDSFSITGTNKIYRKQFNEEWHESELISENLNAISNLGVTYLGNESVVAYTADNDGNAETTNDVELYEYYQDNINRITEDEAIDYGLSMQDNSYAWIHDNQLWERNEGGVELLKLPVNPLYLGNVKILSNEEDKVIVWEQVEDFASDLYAIYYDSSTNSWGEPVRLTEDNKKIRESDGYLTEEGNIRFAFGQADIDESSPELYGKCNLMLSDITGKCDIQAISAGCNYIDYIENENASISVTIKNNSSIGVNKFNVQVLNGDTVVANQEVEKEVISGGTETIEIPYVLPSDLSHTTYTVTVTPTDNDDDDTTNNSVNFELGFADLIVSVGTSNGNVTASVSNVGCLEAMNVQCELLTPEGDVIETTSIGDMAVGTEKTVTFNSINNDAAIVSVKSDSTENLYSNNSAPVNAAQSSRGNVYLILGEYTVENGNLSATATIANEMDEAKNVTVIAASYKEGILDKVISRTISLSADTTQEIPYDFGETNADELKFFTWDSLNGMRPYDKNINLHVEYQN